MNVHEILNKYKRRCSTCDGCGEYYTPDTGSWTCSGCDGSGFYYAIEEDFGKALEYIQKMEAAIRKHRDQKGDDRCFLDDYDLYSVLPEGFKKEKLALHCPEEMLENCKKFIASRQPGGVPYVSPQRRIEELEKENGKLSKEIISLQKQVQIALQCFSTIKKMKPEDFNWKWTQAGKTMMDLVHRAFNQMKEAWTCGSSS
jgi:hypothetical protein